MELEENKIQVLQGLPNEYRYLECAATSLNEGFRLYLEWAPTIFMAHVGLLLFASIRFWDTDYISYLMFPICGLRCMLDAVTPLAIAGYLNEESLKLLRLWNQLIGGVTIPRTLRHSSKLFLESCKVISCKAGSLYVMKSSILPTNLNHLAQLTLNLLIAYPYKSSSESRLITVVET